MSTFNVPTRSEVSKDNQAIFDQLEKGLGFVPNLYATFAHSETALGNFLGLANAKTLFSTKEKEVINLAVSQINECEYCLAAHTAIAGMNGFTEDQILELRTGEATFDTKLDSLAKLAANMTINRGATSQAVLETFFNAGYTKAHAVEAVTLVGEITITNYLHRTTEVAVDFPAAKQLA